MSDKDLKLESTGSCMSFDNKLSLEQLVNCVPPEHRIRQEYNKVFTENARLEKENRWLKAQFENNEGSLLISENYEVESEVECLKKRVEELESAIRKTIEENLHLADGDDCTLIALKRAIELED